jgi:outer membrane protein insertion porin family
VNFRNCCTRLIVILVASAGIFAHTGMVQAQDTGQPRLNITDPTQNAPRALRIGSVNVTGAENHNLTFIMSTANLNIGETVTVPGEELANAIKRLYRTGLFSDVQILEISRTTTEIQLEIRVVEQPRLQEYVLTGIKRSQRRDLRELINLIPGFAVTESSKAQAVNTIHRFYREKGYRYTEVDVSASKTDTIRNRVTLTFDIDAGERIQVRRIMFDGNESFSDRRLRKAMKELKQNTWWRLGRQLFKTEDYETSKDNLANFYRKNGFRDFRIIEDTVFVYDHNRRRRGIAVDLTIQEGPQYFVRNIEWEGNTLYTDAQLTSALAFEKGEVFNEEKFQMNLSGNRTNSDLTSSYHDAGYLFVNIEPNIIEVPGDSLDLKFFIIEDEIAKIRRVYFTGNTKTHDDVVRRNLRNIPGSNYSRSEIIRSVRELSTLGYFVPENIKPDLNADFQNKKVDVIYSLDESASTDNFEFSGGFGGRQFGVILSARVNFNNFSAQNMFRKESWDPLPGGDGQKLSLGAQVTGRGYRNYSFSFTEPWFRGRPHSVGLGLSYSLYKFSETSQFEQFLTSLSYGRRLKWPDDFFTQSSILQYQMFDVFSQEGFIEPGRAYSLSIRQVIERNSIFNPISPEYGSKLMISAEVAPPIGQFKEFYKILTAYQLHIPLIQKLVFTNGLEGGYIGWFGSDQRNQFNRFYLGGTPLQQQQTFYRENIDLKGYPGGFGGSISPLVNGEAVGGTLYNKFFTEMRYPVVANEQIQLIPYVFAEAGNAYLEFSQYDPFNLKRSAGFGLRVFLPILGLVDLSYGKRFDGIPGTAVDPGKWEFLFNIGAPF